MAASNSLDPYGRRVTTPVHAGNCWLHALETLHQQGGKLKVRWNGWIPHAYVEKDGIVREFVYGDLGPNGKLYPLWFKGYGVMR